MAIICFFVLLCFNGSLMGINGEHITQNYMSNYMAIICFFVLLCFNGSLMDINGEQEQTAAFDRFVERIYHGKTLFRQLLHIYIDRLYYLCARFIRYACARLRSVPKRLTLETN